MLEIEKKLRNSIFSIFGIINVIFLIFSLDVDLMESKYQHFCFTLNTERDKFINC